MPVPHITFQPIALKVQSAIGIQYTFGQIQQIALHGLVAVCSLCALRKMSVFIHSPGSVA